MGTSQGPPPTTSPSHFLTSFLKCNAGMLDFLKERGFEPPAGLPRRALPFAFVFGR